MTNSIFQTFEWNNEFLLEHIFLKEDYNDLNDSVFMLTEQYE